jgi:hypothetical protein
MLSRFAADTYVGSTARTPSIHGNNSTELHEVAEPQNQSEGDVHGIIRRNPQPRSGLISITVGETHGRQGPMNLTATKWLNPKTNAKMASMALSALTLSHEVA